MKKVILGFAFIAVVASVKAQDAASGPAFGVKAGANFSNLKATMGDESESGDMKVGFHVGGFVNVPIGETFAFQPEVVFSQEGSKSEILGTDVNTNLSYINVPLLIQYRASGFFAETGPQLGFLIGAKLKADDEDEDIKDQLETFNFSWGVGVGYQLTSGFGFGARYNFGLSNIAKEGDDDNKLKASTIQVGIFKTFGK
jgi:hypothetical protein